MTTLSGYMTPYGGRSVCTVWRENEADLEDLTEEVREKIEVAPVDSLAEALAETLRNTTLQEGRLFFGPDEAARAGGEIPH